MGRVSASGSGKTSLDKCIAEADARIYRADAQLRKRRSDAVQDSADSVVGGESIAPLRRPGSQVVGDMAGAGKLGTQTQGLRGL